MMLIVPVGAIVVTVELRILIEESLVHALECISLSIAFILKVCADLEHVLKG